MPSTKSKGVKVKTAAGKAKDSGSRPNSRNRQQTKKADKGKDKGEEDQPFKVLDNMDTICAKCKLMIDESETLSRTLSSTS